MARSLIRQIAPFGLALLLSTCISEDKSPFAEEPLVSMDVSQIRQRGFINALVDNNSVSYFIYKGQPIGYEYELLKRYARSLKVELKIKIISGIEEAIDLLNKGEGDIIAFPLTITEDRMKYVSFSDVHFSTAQVLVQRKPEILSDSLANEDELIRDPIDLIAREVHVMKDSPFKSRLNELSKELGGEIIIREDSADAETESLIRQVAEGKIDFTVTDQTFASVNSNYFPQLDVSTVMSGPQPIAWAVRKNSDSLRMDINSWLKRVKRSGTFKILFDKYFNSPRTSVIRMNSTYSSLSGGKISVYDDRLKEGAEVLNWDWRLLASIVYQESTFNPKAESWAGAVGLMQVMPVTGVQFKVRDLYDPKQNISAGVRFLKHLDQLWAKTVTDSTERIKFVLASYNVGLTHVIDARNLTRKYGKDPVRWDDNVAYYLLQKTKKQFYRDPIVVAGYCRCEGPVNYVKIVLNRYEEYKMHIN